eukprot:Nitzschia sp. Nitz4//scaffold97_size77645//56683//57609//NITZ4_005525-RA/size77645-processed-gene-0.96-mRNA-1//-1//CDS//3329560677//2906//frame0
MVAAAGVLGVKMIIAALSGMGAATCCHPLDVIRVQMQTEGSEVQSTVQCATSIVKRDGPSALYAGIGAAYLRQWLYGSFRVGVYAFLLERAQNVNIANGVDKNAIPFSTKLLMGCTSGGIGSFVGTPSELALVRMSNDSKLPADRRRNYKGVGDCISRVVKEEGLFALWTGAQVTVLRAMVLSACVLAITSEVKLKLLATGWFGADGKLLGGIPMLFAATMVSSFIANIVANPFDVVKSRTQNQQRNKDGKYKYAGMVDCLLQIVRDEGVVKLWAGFSPAFVKLAPYTVISLLLTEKITEMVTGKAAL